MERITEIEGDLFLAPEGAALIHACNCQGSWGKGIALEFKNKYPAAYKIYRSYCLNLLANPQTGLYPSNDTLTAARGDNKNDIRQRVTKLPEGTALVIPPQLADYDPRNPHAVSVGKGIGNSQNRGRGGRGGRRGRGLSRGRGRGNGTPDSSYPNLTGKRHWIICLFTAWHYAAGKRSSTDEILENTVAAIADLKRQINEGTADPNANKESALLKDTEFWSCRINAGLFGVDWGQSKGILVDSMLNIKVVSPP
ncbi:ADP-ribose 1''-phosphate phosphatase [Microsporum ferrugineum]